MIGTRANSDSHPYVYQLRLGEFYSKVPGYAMEEVQKCHQTIEQRNDVIITEAEPR